MKKIAIVGILVAAVQFMIGTAYAKVPDELKQQFLSRFTPAVPHWALENAHEEPNPQKLRGYVVLMKDGMPAGRAYWFITMSEYEYRPVDIEDGQYKTHLGNPYVYLRRGQVMIIADVSFSARTIYMKLLSDGAVIPEGRVEKHPSRACLTIAFKFPKETISGVKMEDVFKSVEEWARPFPDAASARQFAANIHGEGTPPVDLAIEGKGNKQAPKDTKLLASPYKKGGANLPVIKEGSTIEEVVRALGEPTSKIVLKDKTLYKYSDMTVEFKDGRLVDVEMK